MTAEISATNYQTEKRKNDLVIEKATLPAFTFDNTSFFYDGQPKSIEIQETLPNGVTVTYTNNEQKEVGIYTITAKIDGGNNYINKTLTATLTIEESNGVPSIDNVVFLDQKVTYDGNSHAIEATNLPTGVTATYSPVNVTLEGVHTITATFYYNGTVIGTKTANLTIEKDNSIPSLDNVVFADQKVTYDGNSHTIEATNLPTGVTTTYNPVSVTQEGVHTITATFYFNGNVIGTKTATLTIEKVNTIPSLDNIAFADKTVIYNGTPYTIEATNLPTGVTVEYAPNEAQSIGIHTITATFYFNGNIIGTKTATLTITVPSINNIVFKDKSVSFNDSVQDIVATNLPQGVIVVYDQTKLINAGEYTITATFSADGQVIGTKTAKLVINKIPFGSIVQFKQLKVTYDGQEHELLIVGTLPYGATATYTNNKHTEAGIHTAYVELDGINHLYTKRENKLFINQAVLPTIPFNNATFTYDGLPKSIEIDNSLLPKGATVTYINNEQTAVGTYTVTAKINGGNNYISKDLTAELTIEKDNSIPSLDNVVFVDQKVTYDGNSHTIEATNLPTGVTATYNPVSVTQEGVHTITATFYFNGNVIGTKTATLTIEKVNTIPSLDNVIFVDKTVTYDGKSHSIEATNLPAGVTFICSPMGAIGVGTHTITATFYYNDEEIGTKTATLTIENVNVPSLDNILFADKTVTYDGNMQFIFASNLPTGVTATYSPIGVSAEGTHTITATFYYNNVVIGTKTATLTIEKDNSIPSLENVTFEDLTTVYTGKVQNISATNVPTGVTVDYSPNNLSKEGKYAVTATFMFNGNVIGTKTATLTIYPVVKGVSFSDKSVKFTGNPQNITATKLPKDVKATYSPTNLINAGVYTITATLTYKDVEIETKTAKLTIEKIPFGQVVNFNKMTVTYDGTEKEITIKGNLPQGATVDYVNNKHTNAGTYRAQAILDGINHIKETRPNDLVIKQAKIEGLNFRDGLFTFDGQPKSLKIDGELPDGATVSYLNNDQVQIGTYKVTANIDGGNNYISSTLTATMTIEENNSTPSLENVIFKDETVLFDGNKHNITAANIPNDVTVSYSPTDLTQIGVYSIVATFVYDL